MRRRHETLTAANTVRSRGDVGCNLRHRRPRPLSVRPEPPAEIVSPG
jgi:hypothetical protein